MRKFEIVEDKFIQYENKEIILPKRGTKNSAGYDFYSPISVVIEPNKSALIWTNIKAKFNHDEVLMLFVRSSMGKSHIMVANGTGIIDSDYYGNQNNDGNLAFRLINLGENPYVINKNDKIGQGVFLKYLTVDDEQEITANRNGGFGSTGV